MPKDQNEPKIKIFCLGLFFLQTDLCFPYGIYQRKLEENDTFDAVTCLNLVENVINSFLRSTYINSMYKKSKIVKFN